MNWAEKLLNKSLEEPGYIYNPNSYVKTRVNRGSSTKEVVHSLTAENRQRFGEERLRNIKKYHLEKIILEK